MRQVQLFGRPFFSCSESSLNSFLALFILTGLAVSCLQAQNICREIDGFHEGHGYIRIISGELPTDSIHDYTSEEGLQVVRLFYDGDRLDSLAEDPPTPGVSGAKVTYPSDNVVELSWMENGEPYSSRYYLSDGKVDSLEGLALPDSLALTLTFEYAPDTFVMKIQNEGSLLYTDSIIYSDSVRAAYSVVNELNYTDLEEYCISRDDRCLCYSDSSLTNEVEQHEYVFLEDRLWKVQDPDGETLWEYFWPGRPVAVRGHHAGKLRVTPFPSGFYRIDGRRVPGSRVRGVEVNKDSPEK